MSDQDSLLVGIMTDGHRAIVTPQGRLSTLTAPLLKDALTDLPEDVADIDMELSSLEYISSMGLGVLLAAGKACLSKGGALRLLHPSEVVYDVLDMTGFTEMFAIVRGNEPA